MLSWRSVYEKLQISTEFLVGVLREYAYENLGLKLFALLIAVVLWASVSKQEIVLSTIQGVRLEYVGLPDGVTISNEDHSESVKLQLRGPKNVLERLGPGQLALRVNLTNIEPGDRVMQLSSSDLISSNLRLLDSIEVLNIDPPRTRLTIEKIIQRQVKVVPRFEGSPPKDYEVVSVTVNPSTVTISGPESRVQAIPDAPTETIRLVDRRETFLKKPNIDIKDLKVGILNSPEIEVTVLIGPIRIERRIEGVPLRESSDAHFLPSSVNVELEGLKTVVEGLTQSDITATVDLENIGDGSQAAVKASLPPTISNDVSIKSIEPSQVRIKRRSRR